MVDLPTTSGTPRPAETASPPRYGARYAGTARARRGARVWRTIPKRLGHVVVLTIWITCILLCGACNSVKGDRTQEYPLARLSERAA